MRDRSNIVDSAAISLGHFLRTDRIEYPPVVETFFLQSLFL